MPNYEAAARRAAKKHGIDPDVFVAQLKQESGLRQGLTSSAGAQDIAQFMPATARQYGVTLGDGRAADDLDGAARYMADNLKRTGGDIAAALSIYNSGRPDAYKDPNFAKGQTYNYVKTILGNAKPQKVKAQKQPSTTSQTTAQTVETSPGVDNSGLRRQLVGDFLSQGGIKNSSAVLGLAAQYSQAGDVAPTYGTQVSPSTQGSVSKAKVLKQAGAANALSWAESKVGAAGSSETGENHGKLADYANSRFGMSGQPWCAMFTSLAVTKGGAPKQARTASVAEVRRKALAGDGYQKGLVNPKRAKPGDLVLFGDRHIGMVKSVDGDQITYVGGNQSDSVTQAQTSTSGVDVVRPKYGTRK